MRIILILVNVYPVPLHNIAYSYMYIELMKKQLKLLLLSAVTATFQLQERKRFASWNHRISHPYTPVWNVVCVMIQAAVPQTGIKQMRTTNPTFHDWKRLLGKEIKSKTRVNHKKEEEEKKRGIVMIIVILKWRSANCERCRWKFEREGAAIGKEQSWRLPSLCS